MSRHWVYVGPPDDTPECWKHLPLKCRKCIYRKSESANNYCPFPEGGCILESEAKRREENAGKQKRDESTVVSDDNLE